MGMEETVGFDKYIVNFSKWLKFLSSRFSSCKFGISEGKKTGKQVEESELDDQEKDEGMVREDAEEMDDIVGRVQCRSYHKHDTTKRGEDISWEKSCLWRHEQMTRAAKLEKQLKASWELEELIEEQLNRFRAHYSHAMVPMQLKDVPELLMPKWTPPHELAALSWVGDWRPSAILDLIHGLTHSSGSSSSDSSVKERLSQVMHEICIEETIIEEEMAEIQATCVLHLQFTPLDKKKSGGYALRNIQEEFKKIERVIVKAQQLRFKALELIVMKVLSQNDAVKFFVAFAGIQDAIHQVAEPQKLRKVPVILPAKGL